MTTATAPTFDREKHLKQSIKLIRRHRWMIAALFLVTALTGTVWTLTRTPIYEASATLLIDPEPPKVINIQDVTPIGSAGSEYYQTQYEVIRSRPVLERAALTLNLKDRGVPQAGLASFVSSRTTVEAKRGTRLVYVKFRDPDPMFAASGANAVANGYVKYNLDLKLRGAQDALGWLQEQMAELKSKVQDSSVALQNYRVKAGMLGIQEQRQITAAKIMDFNRAYLEAQAQRLSIEAKLNELTKIAKDRPGAQSIFTVADSSLIQKLKAEASDLEVQKSKLVKVYKEKHPEVLKIDAQIQQVQQKIDNEMQTMLRGVQTEYRVAKAREDTLLNNVNQLRREGQDLNEKEIQYSTLQRETDSNQQLYDAVLKRLKETGMAGGLDTNNIRVIEDAKPPTLPVSPRRTRDLAISIVLGLCIGVGVAFAVEYFDTTIKSPDDVEQRLGLPVIAIVPLFVKR